MDDLIIKLNRVSDSYFSFVAGVLAYVREDPERVQKVKDFIDENASANSSDILGFIMSQPDFLDESSVHETPA